MGFVMPLSKSTVRAYMCAHGTTVVNESRLLCAKTRVAPKEATIPRLELNGALLLAELVHKVAES